jgi:hypothetical protein
MSALSCLPLTPPLPVSMVYRLYPNIDNGQIINNEMVNKKRFSTEFAVGKRGRVSHWFFASCSHISGDFSGICYYFFLSTYIMYAYTAAGRVYIIVK